MDLKDRMAELDARIAARRDALDKKLGLAPAEQSAPSEPPASADPPAPADLPDGAAPSGPDETPPAPERKSAGPAAAKKGAGTSGKKSGGGEGRFAKIMSDMDDGFEIPGLFKVPGIVVKVLFVLCCLSAILNLFWAVRYCFFYRHPAYGVAYVDGYGVHPSYWWMFWPVIVEAGFAYLLWWFCTHKK